MKDQNIELPLPLPTTKDGSDTFVVGYREDDEILRAWGRALIEADRQRRGEPVVQFRTRHCADWYDGNPDHSDGGGPYEVRTLYTAPQPAEPVGWLRNERGLATGPATFDPLFIIGSAEPSGYTATYSPVVIAAPQTAEPTIKESMTVDEPVKVPSEDMPPLDDRAAYSAEHVRQLIRRDRSRFGQPAQPAASAEPLVRYCPGCGSIGPVEPEYRDCCPDGNQARMIPQALAEKCRDTFKVAIREMLAEQAANDAAPTPPAAAQAQQDADKVDAERYRTLRANLGFNGNGEEGMGRFHVSQKTAPGEATYLYEDYLDRALDAARAQQGGQHNDHR